MADSITVPQPPPILVADQPDSWFGESLAPVSPSQPPVIALDQPATAAASAGAGSPAAAGGLWDWLQQGTAVVGYHLPNWSLVVGGLGILFLMGTGKIRRKRR